MITEWIKLVESRLNHGFSCPLKAGMFEYKAGATSQKAMKEISPMFVTSSNKSSEISFNIKLTFMTKFMGKMENILEYNDDEFKMSDL